MTYALAVGLGNPGPDYESTYHNAGRMALDVWASREEGDAAFRRHGDLFEYLKGSLRIFVRPLTFMNESGLAVREALKAFNVEPGRMIVLHDESDLALGSFRLSHGGASAGHKGIQSVIDHIHTDAFGRGRIGVRDPAERGRKKAGDFVLNPMPPADIALIQGAIDELIAALEENN
ncbi:MAG TPA: aminoacyl-tRNA hydrolase [Candidatus Paceibacterota bacterium]|nr:aminoacyl-tRNA hydrolase [Candidatus Paceibacterota bacterium]